MLQIPRAVQALRVALGIAGDANRKIVTAAREETHPARPTSLAPSESLPPPVPPASAEEKAKAFIARFDGGECFLIEPLPGSTKPHEYQAVGQAIEPFRRFDSAYKREVGVEANLRVAMSVLRRDDDLVTWLSDRLLAIAGTVPEEIDGFRLGRPEVFSDRRIFDVAQYPDSMWKKPGEKAPNRAGLAAWGAYVNSSPSMPRMNI